MRTLISVFLALLYTSHALAADLFDFGPSLAQLPSTTVNHPKKGVDSAVGTLISSDGTPDIHYDIGLFIQGTANLDRSKYLLFEKGTIVKSEYYITIPKSDPTNLGFVIVQPIFSAFWSKVSNEEEKRKVLKIYHIFTSNTAEQDAAANP